MEFLPVNADDSREVLEEFRVISVPTVLAIRGGEVAGRVTGAQNEAGYRAMFDSLAEGRQVKIPISPFNRLLRLGTGMLLVMVGISTGSWLVVGIGGIVAFWGIRPLSGLGGQHGVAGARIGDTHPKQPGQMPNGLRFGLRIGSMRRFFKGKYS